MMQYRHVVALGSSFAAGPGIKPVVDRFAARSGRNYAHLLAQRFSADLTDLTVSGATTATIVEHPQRVLIKTFAPQVTGIPSVADLITVTAGGNDVNYLGSLFQTALRARLSTNILTRPFASLISKPSLVVTPEEMESASSGLVRVIEAARERAPGARVVLVGYLSICGPLTRWSPLTPFAPSEIDAIRAIGAQLDQAFAQAASRAAADFVPTSALSLDHALGAAEPWVNGFIWGGAFHPNAAGMRAVADEVYRVVTG